MIDPLEFAETDQAFTELLAGVQQQLDTSERLPDWPFRAPSGFATIYEYDRILGGDFGLVLQALVDVYGDRTVAFVGLEPPMAYYRDAYGLRPGFRIAGGFLAENYAAGLQYRPRGDPTGALGDTINIFGVAGSSGAWSAWGQRDWEIGLLLTREAQGPWLQQPVPWFARDVDLDSIRSPAGWGVPLSEQQRSTFWRNVRERGSGP